MRNAWKRKLAIWLAGCYIATCFGMLPVSAAADTGAASAGGNLITNGSFENLAVGTTGLTQGTHGMTVWNGTGTVVTEKVHGGTNALKLADKTDEGQLTFVYWVNLQKGKTYTFSVDVHETNTNPYFELKVGNDTKYPKATSEAGTNGFKTMTFEYPAEADYSDARIKFALGAAAADTVVYIDNVVVKEKAATDPADKPEEGEKVAKGGFETYETGTDLRTASPFRITSVTEATVTEEYAHEGTKALKVTRDSAAEEGQQIGINYDRVQFEAGKSYLLSAWVRYAPGTAESEWYIRPADVGNDFDYANRGSAIIDGNADFTEIRVIYNCTKAATGRVNVGAAGGGATTGYIDNLSCVELGAPFTLKDAVWNSVAEENGISACPTDAEVTLTFTGNMRQETLKAASLLLNGKEIDENQVAVSVDQTKKADVKISLKNLDYGTHYQLSLKADSTWADRFDRKQTFDPISFKTCGRISVGTKKLYLNGSEITNGKLTAGKIKGEISGLKNLCGETSNASVILALFKNGEMVDAVSSTKAVAPDENVAAKVYAEIDVPSISDGSYEIKFFIWDDLKSGISLSEGISLN